MKYTKDKGLTIEARLTDNITFSHALALLFIGLKLTNHINWHWYLVISPLYLEHVAIFVGGHILRFIGYIFKKIAKKNIRRKNDE
jgi:hypothetical protein